VAPPVVSFVVACSPPIVFYVLLIEGEGTSLLPRRPVGTRTHHSHGSCRNFRTSDCPPHLCRASPAAPSRFPALPRDATIVPSPMHCVAPPWIHHPSRKLQRPWRAPIATPAEAAADTAALPSQLQRPLCRAVVTLPPPCRDCPPDRATLQHMHSQRAVRSCCPSAMAIVQACSLPVPRSADTLHLDLKVKPRLASEWSWS